MIKIERADDFKKTELFLDFGKNKDKKTRDIKFTLRGGDYSCSTTGLDDKTHKRVSTIWKTFATRETLKVAPSIKFNMLENLARTCRDLSDFLVRFTEHGLYQMPSSLPAITSAPSIKVKKDEEVQVDVVEGVKITRVVKKAKPEVAPAVQRRQAAATAGAAAAKNKKARAEKPTGSSREGTTVAKYVYPEGMTADEKKKFRAAARAKAKKAQG